MDLNELYLGPKLLIDVSTLHDKAYVHQLQMNYLIPHHIHIVEIFIVCLIFRKLLRNQMFSLFFFL